MEDNVGGHNKALKLIKLYRHMYGIRAVNWVANSPDLNTIENIWDDLKDGMEMCGLEQCGVSKRAVAHADSLLYLIWADLAPE